ncbi:FG-GAP repeat protein [Thiotrichales bacterium 19X7-9]|nr:FG-GAP repeat protein [Thiotrichales bacterium 19X7-9]
MAKQLRITLVTQFQRIQMVVLLAIGARQNDGNGGNSGHVRVYQFDGTTWSQMGLDIDGESNGDRSGESVSLSDNGMRLAIGGTRNDDGGNNSGHVRVFDWNGLAWVQVGGDIDGEAVNNWFGGSVSLSGDGQRLAVGARLNDGGGGDSGHVRLFEYNGLAWVQMGADLDGEAAFDDFGISVSLNSDGSKVAIGGSGNDGNGNNSGHVRVFDWNGVTWNQMGSDLDGEAASDEFGEDVSLSADGTRVAIGGRFNDDGPGNNSGHVRVFDWNGVTWVQAGSDIDGEAGGDQSGKSVSLSNDGYRLAIGARNNDASGGNSGHVRIYDWIDGNWVQIGIDLDGEAAGDRLGRSLQLSGDGNRLIAGAHLNATDDRGHARVYSLVKDSVTLNYTENDLLTNFYSNFLVSDPDTGTFFSLGTPVVSATITNHLITGGSSENYLGGAGSYNPSTGLFTDGTFLFNFNRSEVEGILNSIGYYNISNDPSITSRTIEIKVNDGIDQGKRIKKLINIVH